MSIYYDSKPVDVDTTFDPTSENAVSGIAVKEAIDEAVQSMYKPGGSILFSNLPVLSADVLGFVYNITDAFTTDARFVEGAGTKCAAGTNVVVVNTGTEQNPVYKFDILAAGAVQVQSDWAQSDTSAVDFIKNKPTIPAVNTAGTGINITNNEISVTDPTLINTATGSNSLTILGDANSAGGSVNIGIGSNAQSSSVAVGCYAKATGINSVAIGANVYTHEKIGSVAIGELIHTWGNYNISIGYGSNTFGNRTIQIGEGRNDDANTVKFGNGTNNWTLLDLTTGLIPADRLPSTAPSIDNTTITKNASNQLQASAVMNARTGTDALPIWQGTEQQWTNGKGTDWYNWRTPLISNFTAGEDCVIDYNAFTALTTWYGNGAINGNISSQPSSLSNIELLIKCKIPSIDPSLGSNNGVYGLTTLGFMSGSTSKYMGVYVYKNGSNYYFCAYAQPDSASIIDPSSTSPLYNFAIDTWFWLKYTKIGNSFVFEYSMNGIDWNTVGSTTYSFAIDSISSIYLTGNMMTSSGVLYDLNECYVKIGGSVYWQPEISQSQCYTTEAEPTTTSTVYSAPNTTSALTITSIGIGTITLSDNNTYSYTSSGDVTTYQTIGDAYPNYLANINGVGVKIGNTLIADNTDTSTLQTTSNLVTSVSSSSTDTQYPSAKLFYDTVGNIEATLDAIIAQGSNS